MIKRYCKTCGNVTVEDAGYYAGSSFYRCKTCGRRGMRDIFPQLTFFHQITASHEVLAEKMVYHIDYGEAGGGYVSTIVEGLWHTKSEAIAATIAKFKEVMK